MTKKLLNPRGYLSWTQVDMFMRSPERYIRQYVHGAAGFENSGMTFGKRMSDALEKGAEEGDALMEAVVALLPRYAKPEHEIRVDFKTLHGVVVLLGKLDTFGMDPIRFREYKSGRVPWTQARANKHRQLLHYAALIYLFYGKLPTEVWLDWVETEETDGEVRFTGRILSFKVEITLLDVLGYLSVVSRVAKEIDAAYRAEIDKLT